MAEEKTRWNDEGSSAAAREIMTGTWYLNIYIKELYGSSVCINYKGRRFVKM